MRQKLNNVKTEYGIKSDLWSPIKRSGKAYDNLPDIDKKIFCENMLQKKGFFEDAYKMMMDYFQDTLKSQKENNIEAGESVKE